MDFILGRDFLLVVGISTYLETEKYNYGKILCMKLGKKRKYCNLFHTQTSHVLMHKYFVLNGFVTSISSFQPLSGSQDYMKLNLIRRFFIHSHFFHWSDM